VPTMGNLHAGHIALLDSARAHARRVVVSIFVNPLQFGPHEDFSRYPRTLEEDAALLSEAGCDALFAPDEAALYPHGRDITQVSVPHLGAELCGLDRIGHFDGVSTVVALLFNIVQPEVAVFGQKDHQQLQIIRRMVRDLHFPVKVVGHPTEREPDGLAMSSRNRYLSAEERARAPRLQATLRELAQRLQDGEHHLAALEADGWRALEAAGFQPTYLSIRDSALGPPREHGELVIAAGARLGKARLIDNVLVKI